MRRFWCFYGGWYYPNGGMQDFIGSVDNLEEAKALVEKQEEYPYAWAHIFDSQENQVVSESWLEPDDWWEWEAPKARDYPFVLVVEG